MESPDLASQYGSICVSSVDDVLGARQTDVLRGWTPRCSPPEAGTLNLHLLQSSLHVPSIFGAQRQDSKCSELIPVWVSGETCTAGACVLNMEGSVEDCLCFNRRCFVCWFDQQWNKKNQYANLPDAFVNSITLQWNWGFRFICGRSATLWPGVFQKDGRRTVRFV